MASKHPRSEVHSSAAQDHQRATGSGPPPPVSYLELNNGQRILLKPHTTQTLYTVYRVDVSAGMHVVVVPSNRPSLESHFTSGSLAAYENPRDDDHPSSALTHSKPSRAQTMTNGRRFDVYRDIPNTAQHNKIISLGPKAGNIAGRHLNHSTHNSLVAQQEQQHAHSAPNVATYGTWTPMATSRVNRDRNKKLYCTHYLRRGECDFLQQGCKFSHDMPSLAKLAELGINGIPQWYQDKMEARAKEQDDCSARLRLQARLCNQYPGRAARDLSSGQTSELTQASDSVTMHGQIAQLPDKAGPIAMTQADRLSCLNLDNSFADLCARLPSLASVPCHSLRPAFTECENTLFPGLGSHYAATSRRSFAD